MTLREAVPKPLRTPLGLVSFFVMLFGITVGYIVTVLGITEYYNLNRPPQSAISNVESLLVLAIGIACLVIGYLGWKGFLEFSY